LIPGASEPVVKMPSERIQPLLRIVVIAFDAVCLRGIQQRGL
jgi:hypothetical protein